MAREYPSYGYLDVSTNKYGFGQQYGSGWQYGLNYPPPKPINFNPVDAPTIIDQTPEFLWTHLSFGWDLPYGDLDPITYQLQINYSVNDFSSPLVDVSGIEAPGLSHALSGVYKLANEGTYYARLRSTDGYTYSDWSDVSIFSLVLFAPVPPTINPVTSPSQDFTQVITGTKPAGTYIYVRDNGGQWYEASYPGGLSGTTWSYTITLIPGMNFIEVVSASAHTSAGAISPPVTARIHLPVLTPTVFNVWNAFDEFGLLVGLGRIPGETNKSYKQRILDVYVNPANATYSGLRYGIARELGLSYGDITINTLSDLADPTSSGNILNSDGHAIGTKLEDYAKEVYDVNPIFWGNLVADESYWDGVETDSNSGYAYLPHIWDAKTAGIYSKWQAPGIGDNDDLKISGPFEYWNEELLSNSWYLHIHTGYFYTANPSGVF